MKPGAPWKRTILLPAFVVLALVQLAVPANMILHREMTIRHGKEYKLRAQPVDPYDAFRGRYVRLNFDVAEAPPPTSDPLKRQQKAYAVLESDSEGFATVASVSLTPPDTDNYLAVRLNPHAQRQPREAPKTDIVWPFERYYMEESAAPEAERMYRERIRTSSVHITFRVLRGTGVITGLYLDDKPIEAALSTP
ncbi:MAG: hypothetical protein BWY59_00590 [Verrucomicrobia bacterium ADurb.Bin345]|nr:MAG: hypothetical protein BWY59_00590 [Verrucomicrobia bacterium ADurb.Bin345]